MSGYLLDTHAYVWAVTDPARLSSASRTVLEDVSTTVFVSAATAWEMATKLRAGRWPEVEPLVRAHEQLLARLRAVPLDIDAADAVRAGGLVWEHRDPFDRVLAAQAMRRDLDLVSRDDAFNEVVGLRTVW